jgi:hypothetical protein
MPAREVIRPMTSENFSRPYGAFFQLNLETTMNNPDAIASGDAQQERLVTMLLLRREY